MEFDKRLKELRKEKNIMQKDLALYLEVSDPTIAKYESGDRFPTTEKLIKIADYFNVSLDYLVGRTNKKSPYSVKKYFQEEINELKKTFDLSEEQIQGIKYSQLEEFIEKNFGEDIPDLKELKAKLSEDDKFQLEDYTEKELKKILEQLYGTEDHISSDSLFNKDRIIEEIKSNTKGTNKYKNIHVIPLYNEITSPEINKNEVNSYINAPTFEIQNKDYFYLKASDNSMKNTGIKKGDTILIRKQDNINYGDIALVWIKDEKSPVIRTVNKLKENDYILQPQNPKFDLEIYKENEIKIIGKITEIRRKV
ncbi:MAG: helix-turn-helix domain-containing protein [bacterium]